jgi:hypothetical protein
MKFKVLSLGLLVVGGAFASEPVVESAVVAAQVSEDQAWEQYKATHSLVLMLKHSVANKERYVKLRLDEMPEDLATNKVGDDNFTYISSADFLPKGTSRESIIVEGSVTGHAAQQEIKAAEETYNYMVVVMPEPFDKKYFFVLSSGDYKCLDVQVVPNKI